MIPMASTFTRLFGFPPVAAEEAQEGLRSQMQNLGADLAAQIDSLQQTWKPTLDQGVVFLTSLREGLALRIGESLPADTPPVIVQWLPPSASLFALVLPLVFGLYLFVCTLCGLLLPKKTRRKKKHRRALPKLDPVRTSTLKPASAEQRLARHAAVATQASVQFGTAPPLLSADDAGHLVNAGLEYSPTTGWTGVHNSKLGEVEFRIQWDRSEGEYGIFSTNQFIRLGVDGACWNRVNGKIHVHGDCHDLVQTYLEFMTWLALKEKELTSAKPTRRAS